MNFSTLYERIKTSIYPILHKFQVNECYLRLNYRQASQTAKALVIKVAASLWNLKLAMPWVDTNTTHSLHF